jgi:hypothetical protein
LKVNFETVTALISLFVNEVGKRSASRYFISVLLFSIVDKFSIPFLNSATGAISFNTAFA